MSQTIYDSWRECITAQPTITREVLRVAKLKRAEGMPNSGTRIYWDKFKPWLDAHIGEIQQDLLKYRDRTKEDIEIEQAEEDLENTKLKNQKLRGEYLDPVDVRVFLAGIGNAISNILKTTFTQLPPKIAGKTTAEIDVELQKTASDVFKLFKSDMEKFLKDVK